MKDTEVTQRERRERLARAGIYTGRPMPIVAPTTRRERLAMGTPPAPPPAPPPAAVAPPMTDDPLRAYDDVIVALGLAPGAAPEEVRAALEALLAELQQTPTGDVSIKTSRGRVLVSRREVATCREVGANVRKYAEQKLARGAR